MITIFDFSLRQVNNKILEKSIQNVIHSRARSYEPESVILPNKPVAI